MKKVLYVEDQDLEGEVVGRLFKQVFRRIFKGEVEFALVPRLATARTAIEANRPDVVLLDLALPDSNTQHTSTVAVEEISKSCPVFILTGNPIDTENLRKTCFAHGADDFMIKEDAHKYPEELCERTYCAYLRRLYRDGNRA